MALMALGTLMVLNTTYFLGRERAGDAFHFFKLHLVHIGAGLVICVIISQFSLAGLRRLVVPLVMHRDRAADPGVDSGAWRGTRPCAPMGPAWSGAGRAIGTGQVRTGILSRGLSRQTTGQSPGILRVARCPRLS